MYYLMNKYNPIGKKDPQTFFFFFVLDEHISQSHNIYYISYTNAHTESGRKWILVGPSMGSIVAQCFIATHPDIVSGFLNMDGLPYPFAARRNKFIKAGGIYKAVANIVWTGFFRPFLWFASLGPLSLLASSNFSVSVIRAQMNECNFYASLAREMVTMMDLTDFASAAWGPAFALAKLSPEELLALSNAQPAKCGDAINAIDSVGEWKTLPRAAAETGGSDWTDVEQTKRVLETLEARAATCSSSETAQAILSRTWPNLVVRCMSARNYDFGPASSFYDKEMQSWAAAEASMHAYLARDGARVVFPTKSHDKMFFTLTGFIAGQVDEIAALVA